ncbi:hypothetical protein ACFYUR_03390 [Micromonospora haikouensis]|uniref:hypothetical protein n=1 Tax=Micromonospora haikouensis TaxID=686309 RepID=UPI0036C1F6F8
MPAEPGVPAGAALAGAALAGAALAGAALAGAALAGAALAVRPVRLTEPAVTADPGPGYPGVLPRPGGTPC